MRKKTKLSDGELAAITYRARAYVIAQLNTMRRYGSAPTLTEAEFDAVVRQCAKPVVEIRLLELKSRRTHDHP